MKKIGLAIGLASAMIALVLAWGGVHMARGAAPPEKPVTQAAYGDVVVNEVAWMGTAASTSDEWIELYNTTDHDIDLTGWTLAAADGTPNIALNSIIPAHGYFLLERTDDNTVSDVPADQVYTGALENDPDAESLELRDGTGTLVDTANGDGGPWPAGDNDTKATMERIDPAAPDTDANWATNDGLTRNGLDASLNPINGTPKARNSRYAIPGLAVDKTGPATITPGFDFTGRIALSNTGDVAVAGVVVTDTLPAGLSFVAQTSPFTFAQPTSGTLVWQVGTLPTDTLQFISLTLRPAQTLSGTVTNAVTATEETGRIETAIWRASVAPYVRLYALHPWALYSDDEAAALVNLGEVTVTLTGWGLSDGNAAPDLTLPDAALPPGGILWLTKDADRFYYIFGFDSDFAITYTAHAVSPLNGTWPGFTNDGEQALLFDSGGNAVDALVYGDGSTATTGWNGAAVPYPRAGFGDGQILYRKLDQVTGRPVPDTDAAADWAQATDDEVNGKKVRYPGWDLEAFFFPAQVTQTAALTVWVAPDGLYEGIAGLLQQAQSSVLVEGYTFESAELAGVITGLLQSGVSVTMLLEGQPAFGLDDQELWACGQMADAGADIYFMHNDPNNKIYDRYDYQHAKLILVDGTTIIVGSENFNPDGMPADPKADGTWGHRGVYLATDAPGVVARAQAILDRDLDATHSDIVPWGSGSYIAPAVFTPTYSTNWVTYTAHFSRPVALSGEFAFEAIQSPENSLRDRDGLLGLLARAGSGDTILVEQLYEQRFWGSDANPRLEAYVAAARRGATVRLLLDSRYDDGGNQATAGYVNGVAHSEGLDLEARLGNPTGEGIHNKMVLAEIGGRGYIHVGSINGSEAASKTNRELALQVQSSRAYEFLQAVFDYDWQASWQSSPHVARVYLPQTADNYVPPADHLVISELLYDPVGVDDADGEWIEIYNPTAVTVTLTGYYLSDGSSYGDGMAIFPPDSSIAPGGVVVVAQTAGGVGFVPDFELQESDPAAPNLMSVSGSIGWGNNGDEAVLRDVSGADVDVVVYGSGSYPGVRPHPGVGWGHSLERKPADRDTDDCSADFWERYTSNPGQVTLD
jgi:uncharacterized repeat protein (TIGR01451 family)